MGLENFEEFYNIIKDELKENGIEVDEEKLRRMMLMIEPWEICSKRRI